MQLRYVLILFQLIAFLFAISIHESAHAWMASRRGDPTARMLGRVTLNPLRHIDIFGTVILPLVAALTGVPLIGWAKPTPVDPRNFKNPVLDDILTSVAGPVSNFIVVVCSLIALVGISVSSPAGAAVVKGLLIGMPADVFGLTPLAVMIFALMEVNLWLGIFNLIPVPPLDGSHVLRHALPSGVRDTYDRLGMVGLLVLVLFGGRVLGMLVNPPMNLIYAVLSRI